MPPRPGKPIGGAAFVHDLATCVGCHACVVACASENATAPGGFWRQVVTFNEDRHPSLPVFHLSLACNHCLDAPCERHCPALAIARDARTGAVLIDADRCIGCRYCSWVCPYDAPRFDAGRGVMGKCTLCHHRLLEDGTPACTTACPTGALKLGTLDGDGPRGVPGFPDVGIRPAIRFLPLRGRAPDPAAEAAAAAAGVAAPEPWPAPERKVSLQSEWTLFAFTSLVISLVAWLGASLLGGPTVRPVPFLLAGGAGLALSTLHLGRKDRAWRAALNWRRSWLSREVLAVPLFLALAAAFLLLAPEQKSAGALATAAGLVALACMDRVYVVMARERRSRGDDTAALLSAAFLAGVLAMQPWLVLPAALARLAAFAERLTLRREPAGPGAWALALARVGVGLALPLALVLTSGRSALPLAVAAALAGELIDRAHFYGSLEVVTPRRRMATDLAARSAGAKLVAAITCVVVLAGLLSPAVAAVRAVDVGPGEWLSVADEGSGDAVLLLPSLTFPAFGFRRVVPLLNAASRRVLVVEPLGLGGSSQPAAADYSLGAQADRVGRVLDALHAGPVVVVAQSGGVSTALRLAYRRPDLVRAVLSIEGGVAEEAMTPGARRAISLAPLLRLLGGQRLIRGRVRRTLAQRSRDAAWVTPDVVDAYLRSAGADFDAILRTYRLMARAREADRLRGNLTRVRCPVRLLVGGSPHPSGVPEEELGAMRAGLARLELETVPRCGHFITEEAPEAVARAVEALLLETAPSPGDGAGAVSAGPLRPQP